MPEIQIAAPRERAIGLLVALLDSGLDVRVKAAVLIFAADVEGDLENFAIRLYEAMKLATPMPGVH